jgi:hypothetical protein
MGHGIPPLFVRRVIQSVDEIGANFLGASHGLLALMLLDENGYILSLRGNSD